MTAHTAAPPPAPAGAEPGRFNGPVAVLVTCLALGFGCGPGSSDEHRGDPLSTLADWQYDEVPADDPAVARARAVFEGVRDVSGQHADLAVLELGRGPVALALADPAVVLSREGLELCYRGVSPAEGDARLAFVLGHELAHLKNGDFWHASAFATALELDGEDEVTRALQDLLAEDPQDRKKAELRADDEGALALVMAGHDPAALFGRGRSFFEEWVQAVPGLMAYQDPEHPTPEARARLLQARLADVVGRVHLFREGVAAYEAGDYERAVDLLSRFRRVFPGREVLSNLALAHLKLATEALAGCDGTLVTRYYLPEALDGETLADRARLRGGLERSSPCFENPAYRRHMDEATRLLRDAVARDPAYLPARLNLVAAFVLDEQGAQAFVAGDEAAKLAPEDPRALGAMATANLAYSDQGGTVLDEERVLGDLAALHERFPDERGIAYNLASALSRRGRPDEAEPVWRAFLRVEPPESAWADVAREWLREEPAGEPAVAER